MLTLVSLVVLAAGPATAPVAREFVASPSWELRARRPDFVWTYPPQELSRRRAGGAVIVCRIGTDGFLSECELEREWPEGAGFGEAAIGMRGRYRVDRDEIRRSAGKWVRLRLTWYPPSGPASSMPREVRRAPVVPLGVTR